MDTTHQDEIERLGYELDEINAALGSGYSWTPAALDRIDLRLDTMFERVLGHSQVLGFRIAELNNASAQLRRELRAKPSPASFLHLKAPTTGHDHNAPTLCGRDDPGLYAYASATSPEYVDKLREESKTEPYPLCPDCDAAYIRGEAADA
jgi:hypothetical protein